MTFPATDEPIQLSGWWIEAEDPKAAVILGHGVISNKSFPHTNRLGVVRRFKEQGYSVLVLDHRGHGESGSSSKLQQPYGAVLAYDFIGGLEFIRSRRDDLPVAVIGMSSSGSASMYAAALDKRVAATVSDCTAAEERSVLLREIPRFTPVPGFLAPALLWVAEHFYGLDLEMMRAIDAVGSISPRPVLIVHTRNDLIVPVSHAERLAAAGPSASLWVVDSPPVGTKAHEMFVKGRGHCRSYFTDPDRYMERVLDFLDRALPKGAPESTLQGFSSTGLSSGQRKPNS